MNKYLTIWSYINWAGRKALHLKNRSYSFSKRKADERIFWLFGVPEHTNIGDQAIVVAEVEFIEKYFSEYKLVMIPEGQVSVAVPVVRKYATARDIITFHGGGNMGDIYPSQEKMRRQVANTFYDRKVMFFPQSTKFNRNQSLKKSIEAYSKNSQLMITFRDKNSYELGKTNFINNKIALTPDIVLLLADKYTNKTHVKRSGIITLLRQDIEKENNSKINDVLNFLKSTNNHVDFSDTTAKHINFISSSFRSKIVDKKLNEVAKHEMVITDRLHGMIFSYITNTPVLVFDNNNHKVKYFYDVWFKNINYIEFAPSEDSLDDIKKRIDKLLNNKEQKNKVNTKSYYDQLISFLEN